MHEQLPRFDYYSNSVWALKYQLLMKFTSLYRNMLIIILLT